MAWTQNDIDALKAAIATGTKSVAYQDRTVVYQDIDSMLKALQAMEAEVAGPGSSTGRSTLASFPSE